LTYEEDKLILNLLQGHIATRRSVITDNAIKVRPKVNPSKLLMEYKDWRVNALRMAIKTATQINKPIVIDFNNGELPDKKEGMKKDILRAAELEQKKVHQDEEKNIWEIR
jgi:hypothetical protein